MTVPSIQVFFTDKYKEEYPDYAKLTAVLKEQMAALVSVCVCVHMDGRMGS